MIRLKIAPEPSSFAKKVREPGENALALLAGKPLPHKRRGKPIAATKQIGGHRVSKKIADFAYWQDCLDELHSAYDGICAYYCFRIEKAALPHVDHFVAKNSGDPNLAYDWSNYRLACGYANACKKEYPDIRDPASIKDGWFQLDLITLGVHANPELEGTLRDGVESTITKLQLRDGRALAVRQHAMAHFRSGRVQLGFLEKDHPFLAKELARQGISTPAQLPFLPPEVINTVEPEL